MVHFARNLLGLVGASKRQDLAVGVRQVFAATCPDAVGKGQAEER